MPVSNPSYFPPQRSTGSIVGITAGLGATGLRQFLGGQSAGTGATVNDLIALGYQAAVGPITDAHAARTIAIGNGALQAATDFSGAGGDAPCTVIGTNALKNAVHVAGNVIIGEAAAQNMAGGSVIQQNVIIGTAACANLVTSQNQQNVIIGYGAGNSSVATSGVNQSVVIGYLAMGNKGGFSTTAAVAIGANCLSGSSHNGTNPGVFIGTSSGTTCLTGVDNVVVGTSTNVGSAGTSNVIIGHAAGSTLGGDLNRSVIIGASTSAIASGNSNVLIGYRAGNGETAAQSFTFVVETYDLVPNRFSLLYGSFSTGNLCVGNSNPGVDRGLLGTNSLKLLNGTGGAVPVGGGYFYVVAGALHWVGSGGTDTVVAPA